MQEKSKPPPDESAEKPHYHGHRERLRERFHSAGPDALSDYELLEMALFPALPRRDTKPLAKALNKVAPKPAAAEHPIASTVPLEAGPHVELPMVTPTESTPPLRVVTHGGKTSRTPRKK